MPNDINGLLSSLRLIRSEGVGPTTFARLVQRFGNPAAALQALPSMKRPLNPADSISIGKEHNRLIKSGGFWLEKSADAYPDLLRHIDDAPPILSALGRIELLQRPMIGIVGARNASTGGRRLAALLARELGQAGYVIVSGLARGIDTAAHEAALETGTIAVLANGVDVVYPPENQALYDSIRKHGVILSENPLGAQPTASSFPRRNRIISGLCQAVIIVEAAMKSGSLITARCALDQGRDVFAVPGSPLDPRASGPNHLIKTGQAHLIESSKDVLEAVGGIRSLVEKSVQKDAYFPEQKPVEIPVPATLSFTDDQARNAVIACLSPTPCEIDHLAHATQLPASQLLAILMELELTGQIQRLHGNQVARI